MLSRFLFFIISLMIFSKAYADNREQKYILKTAQTIRFIDQNQKTVWPGFKISATPSVVHFDSKDFVHVYAFNLIPKNPDWQKLVVDNVPIYYMGKDEYDIKGVTSFDLDMSVFGIEPIKIDGQPAYIYETLNNPDETMLEDIHVLVHERFHGYQFRKFIPTSSWAFTPYDGMLSIENIQLAYLESEPLKVFLIKEDEEALKDFIAINQIRTQSLNKDSAHYEEQKVNVEGIADYVGWKSMNLDDRIYKKIVARSYHMSGACSFSSVENIQNCLENVRYYFVGNAMAIALDRFDTSHWKELLESTGESVHSQLYKHYPMSDKEMKARLEQAKVRYHFSEIQDRISKVMKPYLEEIQQQQNNYNNLPGVEFNLDFAACQETHSESYDKIYEISTNKNLLSNASLKSICPNKTIKLAYTHLPLIYSTFKLRLLLPHPKAVSTSIFKIPADTLLIIDNQKMSTKEFVAARKRVTFQKLAIATPQLSLNIEGVRGVLDASSGSLKLSYPQGLEQKLDLKMLKVKMNHSIN